MTQTSRNSIDIPLLGEGAEDLLARVSPIVGATEFAMRERPKVKGEDKRGTWRRFSDWIFDGILPDSQTNFYGTGEDPELKRSLQEKAGLQRRGGKPFIDSDAGDAQRLAADLLVGFADEGQLPLEGNDADELAGDIMLDMARATISDERSTPEERAQASEVIGDRAIRQMLAKQEAEAELAGMSNADDLTKRIVEMWADGKGEEEIGAELREGGWDYSAADKQMIDRLGQEVEVLLDEGEFGRAKALTFARLNLMKNGGAPDANTNHYDHLLDAYIRADSANMTARDAFSIAGSDAFLSTIRGIGRLTGLGYTTDKDRDILEKMTNESYRTHPIASLAGSFTGGFMDPVFFGISMGAAKAPVTAAQKARYVDDLIARGTPRALASQMGARATAETIATNRLTKYFLNRGLSMRTAQAAGALTWNISDAAITNGIAEGIVAAGEDASPTDIAIRSLKGAGTGIVMGVVLDRAFRGVDKVSRVLTRKIPAQSATRLDDAISYAAAQGKGGQELSVKLRDLTRAWDDAGDRLGRKLTNAEAQEIAQGMGIDLDDLATKRKAQVEELKSRKKARQEQANSGDELTALELEAIEKGIMKAPSPEPTPAERAKQSAEADAKLEEMYGEDLEAYEQGIVRDAPPEPTPEQRKQRAAQADKELEEMYGAELDAEDGSIKTAAYPDRVSIDELAEIESPSADILGADGSTSKELLESSAKMQRDNLDELDHRDGDFVKVYVPIEDLDGIRTGAGEADIAEYQTLDPTTRPPIAAGPPKTGELAEGRSLLVTDGQRRAAAARANGETEIAAYVPEWYASEQGYPKVAPADRAPLADTPSADQLPRQYEPQEPPALPEMPGPDKMPRPQTFERPAGRSEDLGASGDQGAVIPELADEVAEQERLSGIGYRERDALGLGEADPIVVGRAMDGLQKDADNFRLEDELLEGDELDLEELDFIMRDVVSAHFDDQGIELEEWALDDLTARMVGRAQPVLEAKLRQKLKKERTAANGEATTTRPDAERQPVPSDAGDGGSPQSERAAPARADEPAPEPAPRGDEPGADPDAQRAPDEVENPPQTQETPEYLEEIPSEQDDARFFVDTREFEEKLEKGVKRSVPVEGSKVSAAEIRKRRRAIEKKIAEAEKIAGMKNPAGKVRKPTASGGKTIPTFKKAGTHSGFLKEFSKAAGASEEIVMDVSRGGTRATFVTGSVAVRAEMGAWPELARNGWQNDGRYQLEGDAYKPAPELKPRITPDQVDVLFEPNKGTIEIGEIDLQDLVRDARRLKILSDGEFVVLARNPDGSIGWSVRSYDGSTTIRAKDGAEPLGVYDIGNIEKLARVLQRGGETRVTLDMRQLAGSSRPSMRSQNLLAMRGTHNSAIMVSAAGDYAKKAQANLPDEFKSPAPPSDAPSSITPRPGKAARDIPQNIQRTQAAGTDPLPVEGITGTGLDDVQGVPGDQMRLELHNAMPQSGADVGIEAPKAPEWITQPPTTRGGKRAYGRIKSDPKGLKYGVRTIAEALTNALDPLIVRQVREQTSSKNPAHYSPHAHMVRTRSATEPNWMFHEQGHAISAIIRQAKPSFLIENKTRLLEIANWPGSMASANSAEEGFAEFIRRLIVSPDLMSRWPYTDGIVYAMTNANPKIMDAVRDAAKAYHAYMQRPIDARWRSYMNDTKGRPFGSGRVLSRALVDYVSRGFAPELAMRKVMVEVRKDAKSIRDGWQRVEQLESKLRDTAADLIPAYQSLNHIGQMTNIALEGPGKVKAGDPTGLRVHATVVPDELADTFMDRPKLMLEDEGRSMMLGSEERRLLKEAGFKVPGEPAKHGDVVVLADKSVADAIKPVGKEKWAEFETYAQMKATVARIKTRALEGQSFPYQTQGEGVTPINLIREIQRQEKLNPEWKGVFADLEEIANATLLLDVMSGELSVKDAISIKNRFEHYIPLTRQGEGGARAIRSGATTAPSANIRRSRGSVNPAEPLLMALARKLDESVNAYYWNRFAIAPLMLGQTLDKMKGVPWSAKIAANRLAIPLKLDTKKLASASPDEVRKAIYEYIVEQVNSGNELFNISPEELASFTPEDVGIVDGFDIWRKVPPKAVNVLAPNIRGKRHYFQVLDENLYRIFAEGGEQVNTIAKLSETLFAQTTQSLKNQITQSFVFAFRSLARDPLTAFMFGKDPQAMIPLFYHAVGAKAMLTGQKPDSLVSPELLSRVFRQITPEDFAKQRSKSMQLLTEGLVPRGWRDMNALNKSLSAPGIAFRILMKPIELKQVLTGQRALASVMETAPRLGAYIMAKRRGLSDEAAQLAADTVTGNFSERPLSSNAHSIYRTAGFLNPAFQIFGQTVRIGLDPVKSRAVAKAATISGSVAFWTSVIWALNHLASSEEERASNAERTDQERLTHMNIKGFRVPFDYGILGGIQSYTWNTLEELAGGKGVDGDQIARKIVSEVLPHTSLNPLEMTPMSAKAMAEASMGYSLYRDETIEPPYMQYLEPQDRYFDTTPDLYRWVGKAANASPLRIQYFVRNGLGVQLDDMVRMLDRIDQGLELDELASLPELGRMFSREPIGWQSSSVREAADLEREYDQIRARAKRMSENPTIDREAIAEMVQILDKLEPVKQAMREVQNLYDASKDIAESDPERAKELKRQMVEVARQGLIQMQELENEGSNQ